MSKPIIFILEDNLHRIDLFSAKLKDKFNLKIFMDVYTAIEGIDELIESGKTVEMMFLDHDLGGLEFVNSEDENTGFQFAQYIKKNGYISYIKEIVIHSMNSTGAERMKQVLPMATCLPFDILIENIKINI